MLLRSEFPEGRFSDPATFAEIARAERALGVRFPEQLRNLYLECDGFREPLGNAKYLLSLFEEDFIGSLLSATRFWWHKYPQISPGSPDFSRYVFFGMSSGDEAWAIDLDAPHNVISYHHSMIDKFEIAGADIITVYREDYRRYEVG